MAPDGAARGQSVDFIAVNAIAFKTCEQGVMAVLTIRNIDDRVKERLRMRAATHGRSMEEEAHLILRRAVGGVDGPGVWALSRRLFAGGDGVDLVLPDRGGDRAPPDFSDTDEK
jgi:plasmid stability protein